MTDTRLPASGNIRLRWHASNAFSNPKSPTAAELNAGLPIGDSTSWNDWSFGVTGSNALDDPAITSKSNVTDRGAIQYGGSISFYFPEDFEDSTNVHTLTYDALDAPRTVGYISISIDGELSETNTPLYVGGAVQNYANGDYVHILRVMTAGYAHTITGEESFRYTISFLPQGNASIYTVVGATPTVAVLPTTDTLDLSDGEIGVIAGTVGGRAFNGFKWSSSNVAVATVSQTGVVTPIAAGTATIRALYPATGGSSTSAITVQA